MSFRAAFRSIHKWTGIGFAILLAIQAVSGLALAYRDNIQRFLLSEHLQTPVPGELQNIDAMLRHANEAYPDHWVHRIDLRDSGTAMSMLYLQQRVSGNKIYTLANPRSGEIITELSGVQSAPFWLFEFHKSLLSGDLGHTVIALEGAALIFLVCGGVYLWWPGRKRGLLQNIRGVPKAIATFNLHRNIGIVSAPLLLVMAITGTVIVIKILMGTSQPVAEQNALQPGVGLNPAIHQLAHTGRQNIRDLRFSADGDVMTVNLEANNLLRPLATDRAVVDRHTGKVIARHFARDETRLSALYGWMYPLHSGRFLGWLGKGFATSCGLLLMVLIFFGVRLFMVRLSMALFAKNRNRATGRIDIKRSAIKTSAGMPDLHS